MENTKMHIPTEASEQVQEESEKNRNLPTHITDNTIKTSLANFLLNLKPRQVVGENGNDLCNQKYRQLVTLSISNSSSTDNRNKPVLILTNTGMKEHCDSNVIGNVVLDSQVLSKLSCTQLGERTENKKVPMHGSKQSQEDRQSGKPSRYFVCDTEGCNRIFTSEAYLKLHQNSHSGYKTLKCDYEGCDKKFVWPANLKYHQLTHENKRLFACEQCSKAFFTPQRLKVHARIHTGEKPFECKIPGCSKSFSTAGNLANHLRTHTGEKPFPCSEPGCGKKFAELSSLKKHMLTHTGKKPFSCDVCGKTFSQLGSRNTHKKRHLLEKNTAEKKKEETLQGHNELQQNILVLRQTEDDMLFYEDYQGADSVVYSNETFVSDVQVVTVTTQTAECDSQRADNEQLELPSAMLGSEVLSKSIEASPGAAPGASVVVLSQPQEIVSMTTDFHHNAEENCTVEEIVYHEDLLHSNLDHEEIADNGNIQDSDLDVSQEKEVNITNVSDNSETRNIVIMGPILQMEETDAN